MPYGMAAKAFGGYAGALGGAALGGIWGAISDDTSVLGGMVAGLGLGAFAGRYGTAAGQYLGRTGGQLNRLTSMSARSGGRTLSPYSMSMGARFGGAARTAGMSMVADARRTARFIGSGFGNRHAAQASVNAATSAGGATTASARAANTVPSASKYTGRAPSTGAPSRAPITRVPSASKYTRSGTRSTLDAARRFQENVTAAANPTGRASFLRNALNIPNTPYPTMAQRRGTLSAARQASRRGVGY